MRVSTGRFYRRKRHRLYGVRESCARWRLERRLRALAGSVTVAPGWRDLLFLQLDVADLVVGPTGTTRGNNVSRGLYLLSCCVSTVSADMYSIRPVLRVGAGHEGYTGVVVPNSLSRDSSFCGRPKSALWRRPRPGYWWDDELHSPEGGMSRQQRDPREEVLRPLLAAMEGKPGPHGELVEAGRRIAAVLVTHGLPVILNSEGPWSGVWDLEQLTDEEAVAWGMWVATKARQS